MSISVYCPHCHKHTAVSPARVPYTDEYGRHLGYVAAKWDKARGVEWWIGICNAKGCHEPMLILNNGDIIYPPETPTPTDENIPADIAESLDEAKRCLANNCYTACAIMARRSLEIACVKSGCTKYNLSGKIEELKTTQKITVHLFDMAQAVKCIGDDGAHPANNSPISEDDARDVLTLAERFMEALFITPAIAKAQLGKRGK